MTAYRKTLKGASFLSLAEVVNQGCSFLRNVILARHLAKADFGVAAVLAMVLTLFELAGKMALGQQVVQSKYGDDQGFVSAVQFTQVALGTVSAFLILGFSWPAAHFFSSPKYLSSIMALALIPFLNSLSNLDVYRRARRLGFGRLVMVDMIPGVITTAAAWPLAVYFRDYRAVLCIMLARAVLATATSHLLAERRFSMRYDRQWIRLSLQFGGPLLLAGFLQFANMQGDSMVVAASYPLSTLGEFSVAVTMAMTPAFASLRVCQAISLPLMSEVQDDLQRLIERYAIYVELMAFLSCAATLAMIYCGEPLAVIFFGKKYAGVGILASWLIAAQSVRIVRGATVAAAMAKGDTVRSLIANLCRLGALPLSIAVGLLHGSLLWFAVTGFIGEIAALWAAVSRMSSQHAIPVRVTLNPAFLGAGCVVCAAVLKWALPISKSSLANFPLCLGVLTIAGGAFVLTFPRLASVLSRTANGIRVRLLNARRAHNGMPQIAP